MNNEDFDASLCQEFVDEAEEHIGELEPNLLLLEQHPDDMQVLNDCFRNMHSIKGAAGYMGFRGISTLAHSLENLFDQVRSGEFRLDARAMDVVFAGVDRLKRLVHDVADKGTENGPVDDILADVDSILARSVSKGIMEEAGKAVPGHAPSLEAVGEEDEELREIFVQEMKNLFARLTETPQEGEDAPARVAYVLEEMERVPSLRRLRGGPFPNKRRARGVPPGCFFCAGGLGKGSQGGRNGPRTPCRSSGWGVGKRRERRGPS